MNKLPPVLPVEGVLRFAAVTRGRVRGNRHELNLCVPAPCLRGMQQSGWGAAVLVRLCLPDARVFEWGSTICVRGKNAQAFIAVSQQVCTDQVLPDTHVRVELRSASSSAPRAALAAAPGPWFDLLPYAPPETVQEQERLRLWNTRTQLLLPRQVPLIPFAWLLGFYQAEGGKAGRDFTLAQNNPELLAEYVRLCQRVFAFVPTQLVLEVCYGTGREPAQALCRYVLLTGLEATSVRARSGDGGDVAVLRLREGGGLLVAVLCAVLDQINQGRLLQTWPQAALQAYALGMLDGDGSLVNNAALRLGIHDELPAAQAVLWALQHGFGWAPREAANAYKNPSEGLLYYLTLAEAVDLACAGAFRHSYARSRLLWTIEQRVARLRPLLQRFGTAPFSLEACRAAAIDLRGLGKHGYVLADATGHYIAPDMARAVQRAAVLQEELRALQQALPEGPVAGVKGRPNPLSVAAPKVYRAVCANVGWA